LIDWSKMEPREIAHALRTIPRMVAYAWQQEDENTWVRPDVDEYGSAWAITLHRNEDGRWRGLGLSALFDTLEEAKARADSALRQSGWILCDDVTGPAD
jgi:hypothetical protein